MPSPSDLGPELSPAPPVQSNWQERAKDYCQRTVGRIPPKLRWAMVAAVVLAIGFYWYSSMGSAKLKVTGRHAFRNGVISVSIDGKPAFSDQITGTEKKRLGFLSKFEGSFSRAVRVDPGDHVVEVRLLSAIDRFDQSRRCAVNVAAGRESTLLVTSGRTGMWLQFQGSRPDAPASTSDSDYAGYVRSVLLTMGGSALSAGIGFVVQDFLKSRKAPVPVPQQSSPDS